MNPGGVFFLLPFPGVYLGDLGMSIAKNRRGAEPCAEHPEILTDSQPGNAPRQLHRPRAIGTDSLPVHLTILIPAIFTSVGSQPPLGQPPCGVAS